MSLPTYHTITIVNITEKSGYILIDTLLTDKTHLICRAESPRHSFYIYSDDPDKIERSLSIFATKFKITEITHCDKLIPMFYNSYPIDMVKVSSVYEIPQSLLKRTLKFNYTTYESNIPPITRYCIDNQLCIPSTASVYGTIASDGILDIEKIENINPIDCIPMYASVNSTGNIICDIKNTKHEISRNEINILVNEQNVNLIITTHETLINSPIAIKFVTKPNESSIQCDDLKQIITPEWIASCAWLIQHCFIPIKNIITMGITNIFEFLLLYEFNRCGYVLEDIHEQERQKLKGGSIIKPLSGIYSDVVMLDLKNMYATIIIAHNICPTTYTNNEDDAPPKIINNIRRYVPTKIQRGIIPRIASDLISARNNPDLTPETHTIIKQLLTRLYGYMGSTTGKLYRPYEANAITALGRYYLHNTAGIISQFPTMEIIYGHTDSVFIKMWDYESVLHMKKDINKLTNNINKFYPDPMLIREVGLCKKIAFISFNTYIGILYNDDIIIKGLSTNHTLWCDATRNVFNTFAKSLILNPESIQYTKNDIQSALKNMEYDVTKFAHVATKKNKNDQSEIVVTSTTGKIAIDDYNPAQHKIDLDIYTIFIWNILEKIKNLKIRH